MKEMTIRIRAITKEEKKKNPGEEGKPNEYAVTFVGKEKMCERCDDKIECLMGTEKCAAYHADGKTAFGPKNVSIPDIVKWVKQICEEL